MIQPLTPQHQLFSPSSALKLVSPAIYIFFEGGVGLMAPIGFSCFPSNPSFPSASR